MQFRFVPTQDKRLSDRPSFSVGGCRCRSLVQELVRVLLLSAKHLFLAAKQLVLGAKHAVAHA